MVCTCNHEQERRMTLDESLNQNKASKCKGMRASMSKEHKEAPGQITEPIQNKSAKFAASGNAEKPHPQLPAHASTGSVM